MIQLNCSLKYPGQRYTGGLGDWISKMSESLIVSSSNGFPGSIFLITRYNCNYCRQPHEFCVSYLSLHVISVLLVPLDSQGRSDQVDRDRSADICGAKWLTISDQSKSFVIFGNAVHLCLTPWRQIKMPSGLMSPVTEVNFRNKQFTVKTNLAVVHAIAPDIKQVSNVLSCLL